MCRKKRTIINRRITMFKKVLFIFILLSGLLLFSQGNSRIIEKNAIGWFNYNGTFKISPKFAIHTEYQWRRAEYVTNWQQGLLRVGLNYQPNSALQLRVGYAWAETYPYSETPINSFGKNFTEHRIFQMVTATNKISKIDVSHRFMLEQRWVGRYSNANLTTEDSYVFVNRLRYMLRLQMPLKGNTIGNKTPYCAAYNEIFIGFGNNVNENIFDQNRLGFVLGYKFNNQVRLEAGYLNQTLQLGREVGGQNVFQNNNGFLVSTILNFDLQKNKSGL